MAETKVHGGSRIGAGRPKGSGRFGEPSQLIRVPVSRVSELKNLLNDNSYPTKQTFPLFATRVAAGSPSPADDDIERCIDLNDELIDSPKETFFVRASGDSMIKAGIHENDLLVVDRALTPGNGKVVIAVVNSEVTVKRLYLKEKEVWLIPENEDYEPIKITEEMDFRIWGVVTNVVHKL